MKFLGGIFVDNFDKLNAEFADVGNQKHGFKYWAWMILAYLFMLAGLAVGVFALMPGRNRYLALLTLLGGLFGLQMAAWAKGTGDWTKPLRVCQIASFVVLVLACVILYIVLPFVNG